MRGDVRRMDQMTSRIARPAAAAAARAGVELTLHDGLRSVADLWQRFEREADCTAFQTFAWHDAWQRTAGEAAGVRPVVVVGTIGKDVLFLLPLAIARHGLIRSLVWHASELCDYNAPLIAPDFGDYLAVADFTALFQRIRQRIAAAPGCAFDRISLTKMPEMVGGQPNPFMALPTSLNPNGAYSTRLGLNWDEFYHAKRSSSTRRRDRTKRKRLGDLGEVRFATAGTPEDRLATLDVLFDQKSKALQRMGVPDLFSRPDFRAFYFGLVGDPVTKDFVHVSRLEVGSTIAAVNLGLIFGRVYYHVLASYDADAEAARFGPGAAHLHEFMAYAIDKGCLLFDFTIGDEGYKRDWSDGVHKLHDYRFAATPQGLVVSSAENAVAGLKRRIKQSPALWAMAVKLRGLRGARSRVSEAGVAESEAEQDAP
jgi:CelD/BcsL family acetyltransferase involved in cellulose biosynthesis